MISGKKSPFLYLFIVMLPLLLMGCQEVEETAYFLQQKAESTENPVQQRVENTGSPVQQRAGSTEYDVLDMAEKDPVLKLLGKSFDEIKQLKGEPDEAGYSGWLGPHNYILFQQEEGSIRFCSPEPLDHKIAVSIILAPGQEVLGAKVGMPFAEIKDILGEPDFGPEHGMDNLYYMGYYFGETNDGIPEAFISFSADSVNSPTNDVFIKWEAFEYDQM